MAYRRPPKDAERDRRARARERLEAIAVVGTPDLEVHRTRAARAEEEQRAALAATSRLEARRARQRIRDSLAGNVTIWRGTVLSVGTPFALIAAGLLAFQSIALGIAAGVLIPCGVVAAFVVPRALVARERRWLASLPFAVEGYWTALATDNGSSERRVELTVRLAGGSADRPPRDLVEKLAARASATLGPDAAGEAFALTSPTIEAPVLYSEGDPDPYLHRSNKPTRRWLRAFFTGILVPFHDAYPIASVEIREHGTPR